MHIMDLFRLDGKVAILTDGGTGIRKIITEDLALTFSGYVWYTIQRCIYYLATKFSFEALRL